MNILRNGFICIFLTLCTARAQTTSQAFDPTTLSLDGLDAAVAEQFKAVIGQWQQHRQAGEGDLQLAAQKELCLMLHNYRFLKQAMACYLPLGKFESEAVRWPHLYGRAAYELGEWADAQQSFMAALRRENYPPSAHFLARILAAENRSEEALDVINALPAHARLSAVMLSLLGDVYQQVGMLPLALGHYRQALEAVPAADQLHYKIARIEQQLGHEALAEQHLAAAGKTGIALNDVHYSAVTEMIVGEIPHLLQGKQALLNKDYVRAAAAYTQALEYNPQSPVALSNLAVAQSAQGEAAQARATLERLLSIHPEHTGGLFNLASVLMHAEDPAGAVPLLQRLLQLEPNDAEALQLLVTALRRSEQTAAAIALLRSQPLDFSPAVALPLQQQLAVMLTDQGRYAEAVEVLEKSLTLDAQYLPAVLALSKLYSSSPDAAVRNPTRALQLARTAQQKRQDAAVALVWMLAVQASGDCQDRDAVLQMIKSEGLDLEALRQKIKQAGSSDPACFN